MKIYHHIDQGIDPRHPRRPIERRRFVLMSPINPNALFAPHHPEFSL